jgi:hypothetical protein
MKINLALWDRILRLIVGSTMIAWAVAGGPWWAYFGLALLITAAWSFDPVYALLRTGTTRGPVRSLRRD